MKNIENIVLICCNLTFPSSRNNVVRSSLRQWTPSLTFHWLREKPRWTRKNDTNQTRSRQSVIFQSILSSRRINSRWKCLLFRVLTLTDLSFERHFDSTGMYFCWYDWPRPGGASISRARAVKTNRRVKSRTGWMFFRFFVS